MNRSVEEMTCEKITCEKITCNVIWLRQAIAEY